MTHLDQSDELEKKLRAEADEFRRNGSIMRFGRSQIRQQNADYKSEDEMKMVPTKIAPSKTVKTNPHGRGLGTDTLKKMDEQTIARERLERLNAEKKKELPSSSVPSIPLNKTLEDDNKEHLDADVKADGQHVVLPSIPLDKTLADDKKEHLHADGKADGQHEEVPTIHSIHPRVEETPLPSIQPHPKVIPTPLNQQLVSDTKNGTTQIEQEGSDSDKNESPSSRASSVNSNQSRSNSDNVDNKCYLAQFVTYSIIQHQNHNNSNILDVPLKTNPIHN